jgi:hypothetical protein
MKHGVRQEVPAEQRQTAVVKREAQGVQLQDAPVQLRMAVHQVT